MKRQLRCVLGMVGALLLSGCGDETAEPPAASDVWTATPQAPLSPREMAVAVTIGDRVLVVGGSNAPPCPPNAECELPEQPPLTDGAMFDLVTGRWTRIAAAPVPLGGYVDSSAAVVGETVYVLSDWYVSETEDVEISFVSYDTVANAWTVLPNPPADLASWLQLTAAGDQLIAYPSSHEAVNSGSISVADPLPADLLYQPANQAWQVLPTDPHRPSYDRTMLAVQDRVILLCQDLVEDPGVDPPLVRIAALDLAGDTPSAKWTALPDGEFLWPTAYVSVGGLLISPYLGGADGGETNNWGGEYPFGGVVDPETGEWNPFPSVPEDDRDAWGIGPSSITGKRTVINGSWAIDAMTLRWTQVPHRAHDADGTEAPLPTTNHASALVDTPTGPVAFVWGGTRWTSTSDYELLDDGWLWSIPTP